MTIALCTLAQVKSALPIKTADETLDQHLIDLIAAASDDIESYLGRYIKSESHTEIFNVRGGDTAFQLRGFPISSITTIHNDPDWLWAAASLLDSTTYIYNAETGVLEFPAYALIEWPQSLRVIYVGGMAATTAAFVEAYPRVAQVCVHRACYLHRTEKHIGAMAASSQAGNVNWVSDTEFVQSDRDILNRLRLATL